MTIFKNILIYGGLILLAALYNPLPAQDKVFGLDDPRALLEPDPCAEDAALAKQLLQILGPGWGYNYDSLLADLQRWQVSPYVQIESIGSSVQNRPLWLVTITDTIPAQAPAYRIAIHARTHPQEVQSSWVTNAIIKILLAEDDFARLVRRHCVINILPMYNPDGVELGHGRTNANDVDLERQWATANPEPETAALKSLYAGLMDSDLPIRVALNMHSAYGGKRFFVFHHENGTSAAFVEDQKHFIGLIRSYWPEGISDWDTFVSWTTGTPNYYPESWFWLNFGEAVMALTYEDIYNETEHGFDRAADAIIRGVADYLEITSQTALVQSPADQQQNQSRDRLKIYPNPVTRNAAVTISYLNSRDRSVSLALYDILGRRVFAHDGQRIGRGHSEWQLSTANLASGLYFLQLSGLDLHLSVPLIIQ